MEVLDTRAVARVDLLGRKPESIGKPVQGVRTRILNRSSRAAARKAIGRLCLRSTRTTNKKNWIETGDLAYCDEEGDIFLRGRVDDMIVSAGENVYPVELENVLIQHPDVVSVAVVGIADAEFGQRLRAIAVAKKPGPLDKAMLAAWLKPRVARHQMPVSIEFRDELPYTALGKVDKKALRE
ncbi:MAG TPA: fatty acid--CoA ligase family protein [Gemmata sp.]|nr:fatty acid--CoA ligase family protein [Gemmata sp.]